MPLFFLAAAFFAQPLLAQSSVRVVDVSLVPAQHGVSEYLDYLSESGDPLLIEDILADRQPAALRWQQNQAGTPGFGLDVPPHWFRLDVANSSRHELERWLEIRNAVLDEVLFYQVDAQGEVVGFSRTGDAWPTSERAFVHHNLVLPFSIPPGQTQTLYFRVTTQGALEFPLELWTPSAFQKRDQLSLLLFGALFGILLVMAGYNFFVYALFRDVSLLFYAGYAFALMLFLVSLLGFGNQHLWPENAWLRERSLLILIPLVLIFATLFTNAFLQLGQSYPLLQRLAWLLAGALGLLLIFGFFADYSFLIQIQIGSVFPLSALAIWLGARRWFDGYQPARYFILAWIILLLAMSYYALGKQGIFETTALSENAILWGAALEMVLFAFALADRLNSQRNSYIRAQGKALELQRRINEELEYRVQERTQELREAMDDLAGANQRLQALSVQDGLTGIYNRRYFNDKIDKEWQRALRSQESLGLLMIDIDHFKNFNDRYGHLAGDECLKRVARIIEGSITRPSDAAARYGGEEFVVVLPDTSGDGGMHVAERIRKAVQEAEIKLENTEVKVTVSIGVAVMIPRDEHSPQELLAAADQMLYQAKQQGRNRSLLTLVGK